MYDLYGHGYSVDISCVFHTSMLELHSTTMGRTFEWRSTNSTSRTDSKCINPVNTSINTSNLMHCRCLKALIERSDDGNGMNEM